MFHTWLGQRKKKSGSGSNVVANPNQGLYDVPDSDPRPGQPAQVNMYNPVAQYVGYRVRVRSSDSDEGETSGEAEEDDADSSGDEEMNLDPSAPAPPLVEYDLSELNLVVELEKFVPMSSIGPGSQLTIRCPAWRSNSLSPQHFSHVIPRIMQQMQSYNWQTHRLPFLAKGLVSYSFSRIGNLAKIRQLTTHIAFEKLCSRSLTASFRMLTTFVFRTVRPLERWDVWQVLGETGILAGLRSLVVVDAKAQFQQLLAYVRQVQQQGQGQGQAMDKEFDELLFRRGGTTTEPMEKKTMKRLMRYPGKKLRVLKFRDCLFRRTHPELFRTAFPSLKEFAFETSPYYQVARAEMPSHFALVESIAFGRSPLEIVRIGDGPLISDGANWNAMAVAMPQPMFVPEITGLIARLLDTLPFLRKFAFPARTSLGYLPEPDDDEPRPHLFVESITVRVPLEMVLDWKKLLSYVPNVNSLTVKGTYTDGCAAQQRVTAQAQGQAAPVEGEEKKDDPDHMPKRVPIEVFRDVFLSMPNLRHLDLAELWEVVVPPTFFFQAKMRLFALTSVALRLPDAPRGFIEDTLYALGVLPALTDLRVVGPRNGVLPASVKGLYLSESLRTITWTGLPESLASSLLEEMPQLHIVDCSLPFTLPNSQQQYHRQQVATTSNEKLPRTKLVYQTYQHSSDGETLLPPMPLFMRIADALPSHCGPFLQKAVKKARLMTPYCVGSSEADEEAWEDYLDLRNDCRVSERRVRPEGCGDYFRMCVRESLMLVLEKKLAAKVASSSYLVEFVCDSEHASATCIVFSVWGFPGTTWIRSNWTEFNHSVEIRSDESEPYTLLWSFNIDPKVATPSFPSIESLRQITKRVLSGSRSFRVSDLNTTKFAIALTPSIKNLVIMGSSPRGGTGTLSWVENFYHTRLFGSGGASDVRRMVVYESHGASLSEEPRPETWLWEDGQDLLTDTVLRTGWEATGTGQLHEDGTW